MGRSCEGIMTSREAQDFRMAYEMHEKLNCLGVTENAVGTNQNNYIRLSLVDQELELIDPTPNIHTMFVQFDRRFFWNSLSSVEVKWSNRMKCAAGICSFRDRNKQCVISLSAPLLKLRPRKDLVETLLHEMIHAYLFLTNNDRDRDGHGPIFCKHMHRINREAGTNITIYHNFHDEVKLYRQHWWKCNGPCQHKPPFFGMVRRSMNRAPGPTDFWWHEHKQNCNGQFVKIKEPENFKSRSKQSTDRSKPISKDSKTNRSITDWLPKNKILYVPTSSKALNSPSSNASKICTDNDKPSTSKGHEANSSRTSGKNSQDLSQSIKKLGSDSNNVHGWGISRPSENAQKDDAKNLSKNPAFSCSGVLGGSNSGRSNLLTKFDVDQSRLYESFRRKAIAKSSSAAAGGQRSAADNPALNLSQPRNNFVHCPACNAPMTSQNIYSHIDSCLMNDNSSLIDEINNNINNNNNNEELMLPIRTFSPPVAEQNVDADVGPNKRLKVDDSSEYVTCPVCGRMMPDTDINQHLDECLVEADTARKAAIPSTSRKSFDDGVIWSIDSSFNSDLDDSALTEDPEAQPSTSKKDAEREHKCLVCNAQIAPEMSLNEHLEECIGGLFNDDTMVIEDNEDGNDDLAVENNSAENKYPCPVCMEVISENLMNQHLDMCLKNE